MAHIVLQGDSIFDNAPYVPAGTEVQAQLQARLGPRNPVCLDWLVVSYGGTQLQQPD